MDWSQYSSAAKVRCLRALPTSRPSCPPHTQPLQLRTLTIPALKEYLRANRLTVGGKKDELVDRILAHMDKAGPAAAAAADDEE